MCCECKEKESEAQGVSKALLGFDKEKNGF